MNGSEAPIKAGNCLPLRNIPVGTTLHCIEMLPGKGAQMARTAGAAVVLMVLTHRFVCVPVKFAVCTSNAVPPLAKSAIPNRICVNWVKRVQRAGVVFVLPFVVLL